MNETERNFFEAGYMQGTLDTFAMKEDADGCRGCAFEGVNSWEVPCHMCKRNTKDYWRAKKVEE